MGKNSMYCFMTGTSLIDGGLAYSAGKAHATFPQTSSKLASFAAGVGFVCGFLQGLTASGQEGATYSSVLRNAAARGGLRATRNISLYLAALADEPITSGFAYATAAALESASHLGFPGPWQVIKPNEKKPRMRKHELDSTLDACLIEEIEENNSEE